MNTSFADFYISHMIRGNLFLLYASLIHFGGESCRLIGNNIINLAEEVSYFLG